MILKEFRLKYDSENKWNNYYIYLADSALFEWKYKLERTTVPFEIVSTHLYLVNLPMFINDPNVFESPCEVPVITKPSTSTLVLFWSDKNPC